MDYKYSVLKASWGIVIFVKMKEFQDFKVNEDDLAISDKVYLRISCITKVKRDTLLYWVGRAIHDLVDRIEPIIVGERICYVLESLDFVSTDFQEEGLYCAVQGWFAEYYHIKIPNVEVFFDKKSNKYIFPSLSLGPDG